MESLLVSGARIYDTNTKYTGTLTSDPRISDTGSRQVADVHWDNGTRNTVYTSGIRVCR